MWFRRHWYWPSGYIVVGIIVALLTNNIHLSSLSGILLSILAVLLWPFILGAASAASWAFTSRASISPDRKAGWPRRNPSEAGAAAEPRQCVS